MKTTFFIKQPDGNIDYFEYTHNPKRTARPALQEYLNEHYTLEEIVGLEIFECEKLKLTAKFELTEKEQ